VLCPPPFPDCWPAFLRTPSFSGRERLSGRSQPGFLSDIISSCSPSPVEVPQACLNLPSGFRGPPTNFSLGFLGTQSRSVLIVLISSSKTRRSEPSRFFNASVSASSTAPYFFFSPSFALCVPQVPGGNPPPSKAGGPIFRPPGFFSEPYAVWIAAFVWRDLINPSFQLCNPPFVGDDGSVPPRTPSLGGALYPFRRIGR